MRSHSKMGIRTLALPLFIAGLSVPGCGGESPEITPEEPISFEADSDPPVCADTDITEIIDVHEHAVGEHGTEALLQVMDQAGVDKAVVFPMLEGCYEDSLRIISASMEDDSLVPFAAVDVRHPFALSFLESALDQGAAGLKLFNGHGDYHGDLPLYATAPDSLYDHLEETGKPLLMHVNGQRYLDELERVLDEHPDLVMVCPHFCLLSKSPGRLAMLLDDHPNLYVDMSFGHFQNALAGFKTISDDIHAWRSFLRVYPHRMTFGSDLIYSDMDQMNVQAGTMEAYLSQIEDETFEFMGQQYNGFAADPCTRKHILQHNPARFIQGLSPQRAPR